MKLINSILDSFSSEFQEHRQLKLLRIGILVFLIFNAIQLLLFYDASLGYLKLTSKLPSAGFLDGIAYSLSGGGALLMIQIFTGILGMIVSVISNWKRTGSAITYISCLVLFNSTYSINCGGHQLILMLAFFLIFINEKESSYRSDFLNHIGYKALQTQVVFVYLISAIYKLQGTSWLDGSAVWMTLSVDQYSLPLLKSDVNNWFWQLSTYAVLIYQLSFPILIWVKRIRKPFLILGLFMHLFIAFAMGLVEFGIAMVVGYSVFVGNSKPSFQ